MLLVGLMKSMVRRYVSLVRQFYANEISMEVFFEAISEIDFELVRELESLQGLIEHDVGYMGSVDVVYRKLAEIEKKYL